MLAGCQSKVIPLETLVAATSTLEATDAAVMENQYPSSPEEVIRAFLITYPSNQVYAVQYLSPSYVKDLDSASVAKLLPETGEITGFIIEQGSASAESEKSEILAKVAFQNSSNEILFSLEIVDGRWSISNIEIN